MKKRILILSCAALAAIGMNTQAHASSGCIGEYERALDHLEDTRKHVWIGEENNPDIIPDIGIALRDTGGFAFFVPDTYIALGIKSGVLRKQAGELSQAKQLLEEAETGEGVELRQAYQSVSKALREAGKEANASLGDFVIALRYGNDSLELCGNSKVLKKDAIERWAIQYLRQGPTE
jgi:hypothetical protein